MNNMELFNRFTFISHGFMKRNANKQNISHGQGKVLLILNKKDGLSTKELSQILDIKIASLNETLNKLIKKGYIEKKASSNDKRVLLIYLTSKGREFKITPPKDLDVFDCLSDDDKENLNYYLTLICEEFQKKLKKENPEKFKLMLEMRECFLKDCCDFGDDWLKPF